MKKSAMAMFGALAIFGCGFIFPAQTASAATADAIYLGSRVARGVYADGVYQSFASIGQGEAGARYAYESGANNKFLRLANFDGAENSVCTSVVFACEGEFAEATLSFSYRLFEGECAYGASSPVFTAELRGVKRTFTYAELVPSVSENMTWQSVSCSLQGLTGTADRLTLIFHYPSAGRYSETRLCADLDNVSVRAGEERVGSGDLEFADVTEADEKVYEAPGKGSASLMLSDGDIALYEENTQLTDVLRADFNDGLRAARLARQGSSGTFHTAANYTAGGSDLYAVYDSFAQNTFLRLANTNGRIEETQFTTYFYDNATGALGNMPVTEQIFFSFRYRLYIDDYLRAGMRGDEVILHLSTRSSGINHAGEISLDELVLNEAGDDTWHTYESVLDVRRSTTAYIIFTYYAHADSSYASSTFLDFDDLYLSPAMGGANYAHLNGSFEGMAEEGEGGSAFYRSELGAPAQKHAVDSLDGEMFLGAGETFSLRVSMPRSTNVYYVAFDVSAPSGASLTLRLGGRSGDLLPLTVGENAAGDLAVDWESGTRWRCRLYYARSAYGPVTSLDFINTGSENLSIDNVYAGQVVSVSAAAGDFAAYSARLQTLKAEIAADDTLTSSSRLTLNRLILLADRMTARSSEARMQSALSALENGLAGAAHRADMTELLGAIAEAEEALSLRDPAAYGKQARIKFFEALSAARAVTDEDGQAAVDRAAADLRAATSALTVKETDAGADPAVVVAVSAGGAIAGAGSLAGVCLLKRRFL